MATHPSSYRLDLLLSDALPAPERVGLAAHVAECAACRRALERMTDDREAFTVNVYPQTVAAAVRDQRAPFVLRWIWVVAPAMVATAMILLVVQLRTRTWTETKGGPVLQVVAKHGDNVFNVTDGTRLAAGDSIRFVVDPVGSRYVIIAGMDGAGQVTIYYPYGGTSSARLAAGERVELPGSIVLDNAPGPERLVAVFSPGPLAARLVIDALAPYAKLGPESIRAAKAPPVPGARATVLFEKGTP